MELLLNLDESKFEEKNENNNIDKIYENDLNKNMFEFNYIIGKGGFGKVWKVQYKKTKEYFALKEMSKRKIIDKKSENSINSEKKFLSFLNHPFIVNMHYAFQDMDNLYLVIDLLTGGDLRYHISRYHTFSEEQTRFFIACIIYSLSYIHSYNVIHRDIKPENLVLEQNGYLRITDFGIAKDNMPDNSSETSGTPGYMSPEVMNGLNHSFPTDFFAIGVIGYEFLIGKRPYNGKNRKEIKEKMFSEKVYINNEQIKNGFSIEAIDFITIFSYPNIKRLFIRKNLISIYHEKRF
jgi:serine/threonine protein kinase